MHSVYDKIISVHLGNIYVFSDLNLNIHRFYNFVNVNLGKIFVFTEVYNSDFYI